MRTTEAARYARGSVAIAALLAVVVGGVYASRAWQARQAEKAAPPGVPPSVQQRSAEFSISKVEGNQTQFIVRASHATEFKEGGRSLLEDVWITAFGRSGGRSDHLRTQACEYFTEAARMTCGDQVLIDLQGAEQERLHPEGAAMPDAGPDAVQVTTSELSFDHKTGVATSAQPVQFRFPQGEGRAIGLRYDSRRGDLHLLHEVQLVLRPPEDRAASAGEPSASDPIHVSGRTLVYRREGRMLRLNGDTRARRGQQELLAGEMGVELDAEMRAHRLVARDHPQLRRPDGDSPFSLTADELAAPLGRGGQLERVIATGHVRMDARRTDRRDYLEAAWSELMLIPETGEPRQLKATGDVVVQSIGSDGSSRRLQAPALEVQFVSREDGQSRIERAISSPGTLLWHRPAQTSAAKAAERLRLTGLHLDGAFDASGALRELRGSGGVEVQRWMGNAAPVTSTSRELLAHIGPDGDWLSVDQSGAVRLSDAGGSAQGDRAQFYRASDSVVLTGSVILTDTSSRTRARSMTFRQAANELRADGQIASSELQVAASGATGQPIEPAHISSDRLVVDTASGRAVYSGRARLWRGDSLIQADTIDLDRSKHILIATGNVRAVFPQVRPAPPGGTDRQARRPFWQAEAGRMTYEADGRRARLEHNARIHSAEGYMQAARMDLFFAPQADSAESTSRAKGAAPPSPRADTGLGAAYAGQELEQAAAFGAVRVESGDRKATGERADYSAAEGKFVLSGGRPTLHDRHGNAATGRQLTFFLADDTIVIDSEEGSRTLTLHRVEK